MSRSRSGGRFEEFGRVDTEIGESINFDRLAGTDDTSWNKAVPYESDIETVSRLGFKVRSPDGEEWHHVVLAREGDHHVGLCDVRGGSTTTVPASTSALSERRRGPASRRSATSTGGRSGSATSTPPTPPSVATRT
jgi:hypothetical protein